MHKRVSASYPDKKYQVPNNRSNFYIGKLRFINNIKNYIDKNSPFELTVNTFDTATQLTQTAQSKIAVDSDKYLKLMNWLNKNENRWHTAPPASYAADIFVGQNSFRLLYNIGGEGVVPMNFYL